MDCSFLALFPSGTCGTGVVVLESDNSPKSKHYGKEGSK